MTFLQLNATSFNLAEYGGSCPVWNIHTAFYQPGVIMPQFVEMPEGARFFTLSRTVHRPVFSRETQDRRLTLALGCELKHAHRVGYAAEFNFDEPGLFAPIGINCQLCPRTACSQRALQPLLFELPIDTDRRGSTRYPARAKAMIYRDSDAMRTGSPASTKRSCRLVCQEKMKTKR